jgi:hypothetical protein
MLGGEGPPHERIQKMAPDPAGLSCGKPSSLTAKLSAYAAVAGAAVLTAAAFMLPASASVHATTHTLKFTAVSTNSVVFSKKSDGFLDTDVNKAGKKIGFDQVIIVAKLTGSSAGNITFDIKAGMLYGTFAENSRTGKLTSGKVTGGTGAFKHARGTFKAKVIGTTKTAVTLAYHT